jgi:hypothetical protein
MALWSIRCSVLDVGRLSGNEEWKTNAERRTPNIEWHARNGRTFGLLRIVRFDRYSARANKG